MKYIILEDKHRYYMMNNEWEVLEDEDRWHNMSVIAKKCINDHLCGYLVVSSEKKEYEYKIFYKLDCVNLSTDFFQLNL